MQTLQLLKLPVNLYLLGFIFFATLSGYNAYWLVSKFTLAGNTSINFFLKRQLVQVIVIVLGSLGIAYCMIHLHLVMYNIILTFFLLALYSVPLWPIEKLSFTRKMGFLKTLLLAFTWTHVTTLIPLQKSIVHMTAGEGLIFLNRFLFMLLLCIIFDKRDAAMDKIRGLHSLATDLDPKMLHYIMIAIYSGYIAISYLLKGYGVNTWQCDALITAGIAAILVYICSQKKRGYFFYYFVVDGLMLFSALLTYLASI